MNIIDTHLHCWDRDRFHYEWLEGTDLPWRFTPHDIDIDAGGTDRYRAIFMEADRLAAEADDEARWALSDEVADGQGVGIVAAVGHAPLGTGAHGSAVSAGEIEGVVGVRRLLQDEPLDAFADPSLIEDLRLIGKRDLTFDACVRAHQLTALAELAAAAPSTTIVLDHLGKPDTDNPTTATGGAWLDGLGRLAAQPNVVVKLSGVLAQAGSFEPVRPWVEACLDAFGTGRALLGSDWPVSRQRGVAYGAWFDFVLRDCGLDTREREAVGYRNAERFYRIV